MANIFDDIEEMQEYVITVYHWFGAKPYPADLKLVEDPERYGLMDHVAWLENQPWWMVPATVLLLWRLDYPVLTDEAFVYFLPACLVHSVVSRELEIAVWMSYTLTPPQREDGAERLNRIVSLLTPRQRAVVKRFVRDYTAIESIERVDGSPDPLLTFWEGVDG